jgi:hypothetical protein
MKQRLRKFMSSFYWEDIPDVEFKKMEDDLFINLKDVEIHNSAQLSEYLSKEVQIREPLNTSHWRVLIKEDY